MTMMTWRKFRLAAVVVGQSAVVHHLQQQIVNIRMRLFDLIEQQHAVADAWQSPRSAILPDRIRHSPAGAPIRRDTVCRSMYSDMSKRTNSTPMAMASWRVTSVLPTPVGPENKNEPTGLR